MTWSIGIVLRVHCVCIGGRVTWSIGIVFRAIGANIIYMLQSRVEVEHYNSGMQEINALIRM